MARTWVLAGSLPFLVAAAGAQHGSAPDGAGEYRPPVAAASGEGTAALAALELLDGFRGELFAAEPLLANPVCFAIDGRGRFFVAETFRLHAGVTDMREHMDWLDDELACRTVEERVAFMRAHEGERFEAAYGVEHERVRLLWDGDGDGLADRAQVFADGFSQPAAGIAAGLLCVGRGVYYACIPDLWWLEDRDGDGRAERRVAQHTGWGVHVALLGHDMHGLCRGPDGRLYWSIGDRGFHVEHEGRVLAHPHTGAVLRSELDGSHLEVFATGLRNPQELAFDEHGNLFTGDNNSDGGDRARLVYLLEGAEIGWRHAFQYIEQPNARGPWNAEGIWRPAHPGRPAYSLPPVANLADGPAGLAYYPGSGWGPEWRGTFFLCDFRGAASISGVHAFDLRPRGAGFELGQVRRFAWNTLATDVDFGPDGCLYVSDWVNGWGTTGKGRIFRIAPPQATADERAAVAELLGEGMGRRTVAELERLLGHAHQRVRLEAQWELAERAGAGGGDAEACVAVFRRLSADREAPLLARLHALWGLGQVARRSPARAERWIPDLLALRSDPEPEVRAQLWKLVGELAWTNALPLALRALEETDARVAGFAAEALGKLGDPRALRPLVERLAREREDDPWLAHQITWALAGCARAEELAALATDGRPGARRAAVVALRRRADPALARFLDDPDPSVAAEAARAIYDVPVEGALAALARSLERLPAGCDPYRVRRALNACRSAGALEDARRVGSRLGELGEDYAREAIAVLEEWDAPGPRDPVTGEWRPLPARATGALARVAREHPDAVLGWSDEVLAAWAAALERASGVEPEHPALAALARRFPDAGRRGRVAILRALAAHGHPGAEARIESAVADGEPTLRAAALALLAERDPERAVALLEAQIDGADEGADEGALPAAVTALSRIDSPAAAASLARGLREVAAVDPAGTAVLEWLEAAERRAEPEVRAAGDALLAAQRAADPELGAWSWALAGGDARLGRRVFLGKAETSCLKCHAFAREGGSEVGPDLTQVGARLDRRALLRAIVDPNAEVAPEFENWVFALASGEVVVGRVVEETPERLVVQTPQKETLELAPAEIEGRRRDLSSMPQDVASHLGRRELRDLIAFLSEQR